MICDTSVDATVATLDRYATVCSFNSGFFLFGTTPTRSDVESLCECNSMIDYLNQLDEIPDCIVRLVSTGVEVPIREYLYDCFGSCYAATFERTPSTASPTEIVRETPQFTPSTQYNSNGSGSGSGQSDDSGGMSVGAIAGLVCGVLVLALLISLFVIKKSRNKSIDRNDPECGFSTNDPTTAPTLPPTSDFSTTSRNYMKMKSPSNTNRKVGAIWDDPVITSKRIPYEKIKFGARISEGGFGEVLHGTYRSTHVAIKRLLPARRDDVKETERFMEEVKLVATLEHPAIVAFVGVAWDALSEACMVLEYVDGGDLRSLMDRYKESGQKQGITSTKLKIAEQVGHALTYLHSLDPPVIHRDLKSRNVLLTTDFDARLTDFGVSREQADNTMTAAVGTSRWMAPEVAMGQRYDEKADIFSFGVVLSELDTHEVPYSHAKSESSSGSVKCRLPDIAVLQYVMQGELRVCFSARMPEELVQLGYRCVEVDPQLRPSAPEVVYRLIEIQRKYFR